MTDEELRQVLLGGDMRSIGAADAVSSEIAREPSLVAPAVALMSDRDPLVRMRASDAVEKASRRRPDLLQPHKPFLLRLFDRCDQQEVQWHLLQLLPRLELTPEERVDVLSRAKERLASRSRIVAAEALSALFALSAHDPALRAAAVETARALPETAAPSLRARARRLLASLD